RSNHQRNQAEKYALRDERAEDLAAAGSATAQDRDCIKLAIHQLLGHHAHKNKYQHHYLNSQNSDRDSRQRDARIVLFKNAGAVRSVEYSAREGDFLKIWILCKRLCTAL